MAGDGSITASAPGSLMLLGEHAVLHGHHAIVAAVNRRIQVRLTPSATDSFSIRSALGIYEAPLAEPGDHPVFRFVLQAVRSEAAALPGGFELAIEAAFASDIGFGSSAAVTAAVHAALMAWSRGAAPSPQTLFERARDTVRTVQGRGSGADVAASVFGGAVLYSIHEVPRPLGVVLPLTAVYCGYKTPTVEVIQQVEQARAADPERFMHMYEAMDRSAQEAAECLRCRNLPAFGRIIDRNHVLMDELGVNTPELQEIVTALRAEPGICGAKISGSGLGDCAVGIGSADLTGLRYPVHHLKISPDGIQYHG